MLPVLIRNIHGQVSAQELVNALNDNLPAPDHVEAHHITFISSGHSRSTILLFRRQSALRSIKKPPFPVLHGQPISVDTDFYGLNVLSEEMEPTIDIVALHGLNGHAFNTWATKEGRMWLRDFLPRDIPNARILTYGYDTKPSSASFAGIEDFALGFLAELYDKRRDVGTRKLILIGHSLGGILIKKALITARESADYQSMIDYLSGIVFFGTPHQGSTATTPALYVAHLAKVVNVRFRRDLIQILQRDSEFLFNTARSFERFLRANTLEIKLFYETKQTSYGCAFLKKEFKVVDQQSASPVQWGEPVPLNADHIEMCKFERTPEYDKVRNRIMDLAAKDCVIDARTAYLNREILPALREQLGTVQESTTGQSDGIATVRRHLQELEARQPLQTVVTNLNLIISPLEKLGLADRIKTFKDEVSLPTGASRVIPVGTTHSATQQVNAGDHIPERQLTGFASTIPSRDKAGSDSPISESGVSFSGADAAIMADAFRKTLRTIPSRDKAGSDSPIGESGGRFSGADAAIMADAFRATLRTPLHRNEEHTETGGNGTQADNPADSELVSQLAEEGRHIRSVSSSRSP